MSLKILVISTWLPARNNNSGIFVWEQVAALNKRGGVEAKIMTFNYQSLKNYFKKVIGIEKKNESLTDKYTPVVSCHTTNIFPIRFFSNPKKLQKKKIMASARKCFKNYITKFGKPDVIHHHGLSDYCYITYYLSKRFDVPYIITEHSPVWKSELTTFNPYETTEEKMRMIENASARIAVSKHYKIIYESLLNCEFTVVPNMVADLFNDIPYRNKNFDKKNFSYINIGSLIGYKGQHILLESFAEAAKEYSGMKLKIVGEGINLEKLKGIAKSKGIEDKVIFYGHQPRENILKLIDESNVLVVSSLKETFSIVTAEAFFRGKPVVATKCGGPEELINETNGLLCNVNDSASMASAMKNIYTNYINYDGEKIRNDALSKYSEKIVVQKLIEIYQQVGNKTIR